MTGVPGFLQRHRTGVTFTALVFFCLLSILISNRNVVLKPKEVGQSFFSLFQITANGVAGWFAGTWSALGELKRLRQELGEARDRLVGDERGSRGPAGPRPGTPGPRA